MIIYLRIIPDQMHFIDIVRPIVIISQKKKEKRRKREEKEPKENHARVKIFQPTTNLGSSIREGSEKQLLKVRKKAGSTDIIKKARKERSSRRRMQCSDP